MLKSPVGSLVSGKQMDSRRVVSKWRVSDWIASDFIAMDSKRPAKKVGAPTKRGEHRSSENGQEDAGQKLLMKFVYKDLSEPLGTFRNLSEPGIQRIVLNQQTECAEECSSPDSTSPPDLIFIVVLAFTIFEGHLEASLERLLVSSPGMTAYAV